MKRLVFLTVLSLVAASLASGCLWGVVWDAETGQVIQQGRVTYSDSGHGWGGADIHNGIYVFDASTEYPPPVSGPVRFAVSYTVCGEHQFFERVLHYNEGSSWWLGDFSNVVERQDFPLQWCAAGGPTPTVTSTVTVTPTPTPTATPTPKWWPMPLPTSTPFPPPR
jgi:hypothetical protein